MRQVSFTLLMMSGVSVCTKVARLFGIKLLVVLTIEVLLSTRGTAGPDIWFMCLIDRSVARSYVRGIMTERL